MVFLDDLEEKDRFLDKLFNYGGVCITAPATQGLLNMMSFDYSINTFVIHSLIE